MVSFIQLLVAFSVVVRLIDSKPIPDDVIHELVMNAIHTHDLVPLVGNITVIIVTWKMLYSTGHASSVTMRELR
jgi:hypothetical protein